MKYEKNYKKKILSKSTVLLGVIGYGVLCFAKNRGKNITKNLSDKYSAVTPPDICATSATKLTQKGLDGAKKSGAAKFAKKPFLINLLDII